MSLRRVQSRLSSKLSGAVRRNEPMSQHTTYRIGGPADLFIECDTVHDLNYTLETLAEEHVDLRILGKGSNLLVADAGFRGAVLVLGRDFKRHGIEDGHLRSGAGAILAALVQDAFSKGMSGLAFAVGIPGTVGGALAMNAGSRDEWIGYAVESVTVLIAGEGLGALRGTEIDWGYRYSDLPARGVIVECALRVEEGDVNAIQRTMEASFERRKATQPVGKACAGSVFRNPPGDSAGRLIEACGMKGFRLGAAAVSEVHANFIVNEGGATAAEVMELIRQVRAIVKDEYGIELETEIQFIGSFPA